MFGKKEKKKVAVEESLWERLKKETEFGEEYAVLRDESAVFYADPKVLDEFYKHGWELVSADYHGDSLYFIRGLLVRTT